jgi:hypothetical protein
MSANVGIALVGGVRPSQVFWAIGGATTIGAGADFMGILLDQTSVNLGAGATLRGRILAQSSVGLIKNQIEQPNDNGCSGTVTLCKSS